MTDFLQSSAILEDLEIIKVIKTSAPATTPNSTSTRTINHGLGFVPLVFAFLDFETGFEPLPLWTYASIGASIAFGGFIKARADINNLYIDFDNCTDTRADGDLLVKAYLCRLTAN